MQGFEPCKNLDWPEASSLMKLTNWGDELCMIESELSEFYNLPFDLPCGIEPITIPSHYEDCSQKSITLSSLEAQKDEAPAIQVVSQTKTKIKMARSKTGCNCKKSSCLKSYCECYSNGGYCSQGCGCENCKNNVSHSTFVETTRNKQKTKANKSGHQCQCKKSKCQKKYCECFEAGVACGPCCKCQGCSNCNDTSHSYSPQANMSANSQLKIRLIH